MNGLLQVFDPANVGAFFAQFQADLQKPAFWLAVGKIIWINVLLSGDNALVIAMACRGLRAAATAVGHGHRRRHRRGAADHFHRHRRDADGAALSEAGRRTGAARRSRPSFWCRTTRATTSPPAPAFGMPIRIVVIADIIMSLDNVIAVAAAANGQLPLLILGLAISIPMIIAGAALIMLVLDRLPDSGLARRDLAGLDRGRRDRDRSGGSSAPAPAARRPDRPPARRDLGDFRRVAARHAGRRSRRIHLLGARARSRCWWRDRSGGNAGCAIEHPRSPAAAEAAPADRSADSRCHRIARFSV